MWWKALTVIFMLSLMAGERAVFRPRPGLPQEAQVKVTSAVVNVPVVVYDKRTGAVYRNLKQESFQVFEDQVRQQITHFAPISGSINLVLVLENNRRLREIDRGDFQPLIADVVAAASIFVTRHLQPGDYVAFVSFDNRPKVESDFTDNVGQLRQQVMRVAQDLTTFSESSLYDALLFVLMGGRDRDGNEYKGLVEVEGHTGVLVVATGFDTFSRVNFDQMLKVVERAGVPIYTLGIGDLLYKRLGDWLSGPASLGFLQAAATLRAIAERSGGRYYPVTFESQLPSILESVSTLLHNQYNLGYTPTNPRTQGKQRKIEILVDVDGDEKPDNDRLIVQYRRSYHEPEGEEGWLASQRSFLGRELQP